jgi:hypothetical protein
MEANLHAKMEEFMTTLDEVKKYKETALALADFILIVALAVVVLLAFNISLRFVSLFWFDVNPYLGGFDASINLVILLVGVAYGIRRAQERMARLPKKQWKGTIDEGAPGAIRLLQELNWESIFREIGYAKIGFVVYGIIKIVAYWILAAFILVLVGDFFSFIVHVPADALMITLPILALAVVVYLDRNDLRKRYDQVWNLDLLLWELRWFDSEFRRADFEA